SPLSHSFCQHCLGSLDPLVIEDARLDPRVRESAAIQDFQAIAYLGIPLRTSDCFALGSFCAIDNKPRAWTDDDISIMQDLAALATTEIELREVCQKTQRQAAQIESDAREKIALLESTGEGIYGVDMHGCCTFINRAGAEMLGYTVEQVQGQNIHELIHHSRPDGTPLPQFNCPLYRARVTGQGVSLPDEWLWRKDGTGFPADCSSFPLKEADEVVGVVVAFRDVSAQREMEERLAREAFLDAVTGVPNRRLFMDRLEHALKSLDRRPRTLAVMFIDLDRFKLVNDVWGHEAGDELLRSVAQRLQSSLRMSDTVARFGGDEFVILLDDVADGPRARALARRLLRELTTRFMVGGRETFVSASMGLVMCSTSATSAEALLRDADVALYRAKAGGKARYVVFDEKMSAAAARRLELETALYHAVDRDELRLVYQPQVELESGRVVGLEALVRWQHPTRGLLVPADFLVIAEETGLVWPIGRWVRAEACRQLAVWNRRRSGMPPLRISLNLSTQEFLNPELFPELSSLFETTGLAPGNVQLEINERTLLADVDQAVRTLHDLKELGVRIALDDFGAGFASLGYLRRFLVDVLKIDRLFVAELAHDATSRAILQIVVDLGRALNMEISAEGVETAEQRAALQAVDCSFAQGYSLFPPMDAGAVSRLLELPVTDVQLGLPYAELASS
ncbi:MAG TPA: EAL domain-containing protein, partial [Armatimonadota bacterium]|nr:EAL domain-containing protein [Armatimonadota bacterium]